MFKEDAASVAFLRNKQLWENTTPLADFLGKADEFDAIFIPGGHGPMYDLAVDETSQKLIAEFAEKGKVVSSVCHGPAAFVNVRLSDGRHLLEGKTVTGFTNEEEEQVGLTKVVPFLLEDKLREGVGAGGKFVKADQAWGEKVVVDGKLITGQNPNSAKAVGEALVKAVKA